MFIPENVFCWIEKQYPIIELSSDPFTQNIQFSDLLRWELNITKQHFGMQVYKAWERKWEFKSFNLLYKRAYEENQTIFTQQDCLN